MRPSRWPGHDCRSKWITARKEWEADAIFASYGGILELHWNGTKLVDVETMVEWAQSMTWKKIHPIIELSRKVCHKGGDARQEYDAGGRSPSGVPP